MGGQRIEYRRCNKDHCGFGCAEMLVHNGRLLGHSLGVEQKYTFKGQNLKFAIECDAGFQIAAGVEVTCDARHENNTSGQAKWYTNHKQEPQLLNPENRLWTAQLCKRSVAAFAVAA